MEDAKVTQTENNEKGDTNNLPKAVGGSYTLTDGKVTVHVEGGIVRYVG